MASLALALCAGSYGLHKLPEHLKSETGLLLIHRPFAPMPCCPQFSLPTPDTHGRAHYGYGYGAVRCGAVRCVAPRHSSSASRGGQIQEPTTHEGGFCARAYCMEHPTANKHDSPALTARFSLPNARVAIWI